MTRSRAWARLAAAMLLIAAPAAAMGAAEYHEAPMLAAMVKAGKLPPVEQRLPEQPMVVKPLERPGRYGGDLRTGLVGGGMLSQMYRFHAYEPLLRYTPDWSGVIPNVAESFSGSADATEFTVRLRRGMKWSDGAPFNVDDVMFWYQDGFLNADVNPVQQDHLMVDGKKAVFERIDDYGFKVIFPEPNGLFPSLVAWGNRDETTRFPKHYLRQFHIAYNPNADALAKSTGLSGWVQLFESKAGASTDDNLRNSDMPVLTAWKMQVAPGETTTRAITVRNPYYWKVDTAGNQLPYLDRLTYDLVNDAQVMLLKTMQGEIDIIDQFIATPANKSVLFDNQQRGGYHFYRVTPTEPNEMAIILNLTHPDPVKRALFLDKDFRIAISHAIDRQALIDAVLVGQGEPAQVSIRPSDVLYNEKLAKQYLDYDPDLANAMLDRIVPNKDADGIRLDSQRRRLTIVFEVDQGRVNIVDMMQLVLPMLRRVGIDAQLRTMDRSLYEVRTRQGNDFDATAYRFGGSGGQAAILDMRYWAALDRNTYYAKGWQLWYNDRTAKGAVEPPAAEQRIMGLYDKLKRAVTSDAQIGLMRQILDIDAQEFYVMGVTLPADGYGVVKNNLHNVPDSLPNSFGFPTPAPANPEQFYKD